MRKIFMFITLLFCSYTHAQDNSSALNGLEFFGSVDTYWKYDFAKQTNIPTFFTEDHNSISIGMIDIGIKKRMGKASFLGELSFGPRGQYRSLLNGDGDLANSNNSFHIQNLLVGYDFTEKFNVTAGFMGTFIGYEVISPAANFHYSTSYIFGAGPFQNAGIKASYGFSDKVSLMVGLFNDWNVYQDFNGVSHVGGQLTVIPAEGYNFYLNFLSGSSAGGIENYSSGTLIDFVSTLDLTPKFSLGINAVNYNQQSEGGYLGLALYPKYAINEHIEAGLRGEYFQVKETEVDPGDKLTAVTLSFQIKHQSLLVIPEVRLDTSNKMNFYKADFFTPTSNAAQVSLALVYIF
ncbi:porin [Sphingobacteriaceae bacterium WQ 2009]|uniref:Porin n=1 Tax=Rhinopithecimicrobium faecis TaxID=2820698 RepID=A0A8T4H9M2_9SPHI|nr:porin [Sphingobacteriaceae bacterium WQ 2009]